MRITFDNCNRAIAAGIAIGIGGTAYLSTGNPWLFPIGLFMVCYFGMNLFTGKVCSFRGQQLGGFILMWFLNTIGAYITGLLIGFSKPGLVEKAQSMVEMKLTEGIAIIPLAFFCNVLIFVAVKSFQDAGKIIAQNFLTLVLATTAFVACGFEHCVANAFYFGVAGKLNISVLLFLGANAVWNAIGGMVASIVTDKWR